MSNINSRFISAIRKRDIGAVRKALDAGADVNGSDREDVTALTHAVPNVVLMRLLLDEGADQAANDNAAFRVAAMFGAIDAIEVLVESGADTETRDVDGRTAIFWAANRDRLELLEYLIEAGADVNAMDDLECTPIMIATPKTMPLLLAAGADPYLEDSAGYNAIDFVEGQLEFKDGAEANRDRARLKLMRAYTPRKVKAAQKKRTQPSSRKKGRVTKGAQKDAAKKKVVKKKVVKKKVVKKKVVKKKGQRSSSVPSRKK